MTTTHARKLHPCPACHGSGSKLTLLPDPTDLPPLPIGALAAGVVTLLQEAADLPAPGYIAIFDTQHISVQFSPDPSSLRAITRWALRFGGVVASKPHQGKDGSETWCSTEFGYYGMSGRAYAHIPAAPGGHDAGNIPAAAT
ncbi:MAG: hypothetical protein JO037_03895 [Actinobacteria bacterium]|nr:hypothetical protein [Actinomycetota bacterium]